MEALEEITGKKHWTKTPFTNIKKLHNLYKSELQDLSTFILEQKEQETPLWTKLRVQKQNRLYRTQNISPITFPEFRKMLVTRHDELPSLR